MKDEKIEHAKKEVERLRVLNATKGLTLHELIQFDKYKNILKKNKKS